MANSASVPALEDTDERQAALRRYHILDTAPEKDFDRITSLVSKVCRVPTALITLIDKERQWFKSCFGFDTRQTDISVSFCVHAVHDGEMLVVEDATQDPRFKDNPIVTGPPHIRFYAGAPLTTPEGLHIGTLCFIDYKARAFDAAQREILERLADVVVSQFELRSAEAQVRQLVHDNPQPMIVYSQHEDTIMLANEAAQALYGYDEAVFKLLSYSDIRAEARYQNPTGALAVHEDANGTRFHVQVQEQDVLFDGYEATLATVQRMPVQNANALFFLLDRSGVIRSVSKQATDSVSFDATAENTFNDMVAPFDSGLVESNLAALFEGKQELWNNEVNVQGVGDGSVMDLHLRAMSKPTGRGVGAVAAVLTPVANLRPTDHEVPERDAPPVEQPEASESPEPASDTSSTEADTSHPDDATEPDGSNEEETTEEQQVASDGESDEEAFEPSAEDSAEETTEQASNETSETDESETARQTDPADSDGAPSESASDASTTDASSPSDNTSKRSSVDLPSFPDAKPHTASAPHHTPHNGSDNEADENTSDSNRETLF